MRVARRTSVSSFNCRELSPDRLRITQGGGCVSLFGTPFLAAGVLVTLAALGVVPMSNGRDLQGWNFLVLGAMGLVFTAVGAGLVFGRGWITFDRRLGTVRQERGLLVPMRSVERRIYDCEAVLLRCSSGDSDTAASYPVTLKAKSGCGSDLSLGGGGSYGRSREHAARVAQFLNLPLVDDTTDHETRLAPDQVDLSVGERLHAGSDGPAGPEVEVEAPPDMQSRVTRSADGVLITLPPRRVPAAGLIAMAIPCVAVLWFAPATIALLGSTGTPLWVQLFFGGFGLVVVILGPLSSLLGALRAARRGGTSLLVSPAGITVTERGAWRDRVTRTAAEDILGLDYSTAGTVRTAMQREAAKRARQAGRDDVEIPRWVRDPDTGQQPRWLTVLSRLVRSRGLLVKTRTGILEFGGGLPDVEIAYLHGVVVGAMGASPPTPGRPAV